MKKKYKSLVVIGITLIVILGAIGCSKNSDSKKSDEKNTNNQGIQNTNDSEALYESTLVEVQNINDNSDMLGAVLLSEPDREVPSEEPISLPLDNGEIDGFYYVSLYHGKSVITQIELESPNVNVLGISVGDDKQVIADKMKDSAYELSEPIHDYQIVYRAYHLSVSFKLSEDGKIVSILVYVYDPTEEIPTY